MTENTDAWKDKLGEVELAWPTWVPGLAGLIALLAVTAAIVQRQAALWPGVLFALIALLPFLLDAIDVLVPFKTALPLEIFPWPAILGTALLISQPAEIDFAPFTLVFVSAEVASRAARKWFGVAVTLVSCAVMVGFDVFGKWDESFVWVIGISFGWFGGFLVQTLYRTASELKRAEAGLAQKAAAEERSRIAREVHDVIAHSLSVTMLHVTAARMALEKEQRMEALESLREAETQGRNSLAEIRRTVGLLGPDELATAPPMPVAADLPKLVSDFRTAGLDVELVMNGDVSSLPPGAGLNLYRIVQESLTNASKHAPGAKTSVELNVTDADIRLRVFNEGGNGSKQIDAAGGGRGFRGMVERAVMMNGSLVSGAEAGGWLVVLAAPRPTE